MSKSLLEEIQQSGNLPPPTPTPTTKSLFTQDFGKRCACVMRRNYYALETSSIKESFDSDVFDLYDDHKYDSVERPTKSHFTFNALSIDETSQDDTTTTPTSRTTKDSYERYSLESSNTRDHASDNDDSFDSVIFNGHRSKSFDENPIITNDFNKINDLLRKYRATSEERLSSHRKSIEQLQVVQSKVKEVSDLDHNVNSLIFRAVEVHTDILVMDTTVTRLLAETRQLVEELEDVKFLDDLIDLLNKDIGPVIHREWKYAINSDAPIEEGIAVT